MNGTQKVIVEFRFGSYYYNYVWYLLLSMDVYHTSTIFKYNLWKILIITCFKNILHTYQLSIDAICYVTRNCNRDIRWVHACLN